MTISTRLRRRYDPQMAGFAIFMEFLLFGFLALCGASIGSIVLFVAARRERKLMGRGDPGAVRAIVSAPFLGLLWVVVALVVHVEISNKLAHQSVGFSPDPYVTLPNGYVLGSGNTYDGYIRAPGFAGDVPVAGQGYVRSLIDLEWSEPYFTGTQFDFKTSQVRSFLFDTRDRSFRVLATSGPPPHPNDSQNPADLAQWDAAQTASRIDANSYWVLYARYLHQWPTYVFQTLLLLGEIAVIAWTWRLWRRSFPRPSGNLSLSQTTAGED